MTLGGLKRFLLKNRKKFFHISGVAEQLENVSLEASTFSLNLVKSDSKLLEALELEGLGLEAQNLKF